MKTKAPLQSLNDGFSYLEKVSLIVRQGGAFFLKGNLQCIKI